MEFIEVIKKYLNTDATEEDLAEIQKILSAKQHPLLPIEENRVRQGILEASLKMWNGSNKLQIVKFVKDLTGMGLKDAKDWCESKIFPQPFNSPL